jgi:hypothetical protein
VAGPLRVACVECLVLTVTACGAVAVLVLGVDAGMGADVDELALGACWPTI